MQHFRASGNVFFATNYGGGRDWPVRAILISLNLVTTLHCPNWNSVIAPNYWNSSSHVSKVKDQDTYSYYIWSGMYFTTFESFILKQCMKQNMVIPKLEGRGWFVKDWKFPVLYVGEQLPPSCGKRKTKRESWITVQIANWISEANMQMNLMLLIMVMLMKTMIII